MSRQHVICKHGNCTNFSEEGKDECYRHRLLSVGFTLRAPAIAGDFHRTAREWKEEHLGTSDDRELAKRGIERV